MRILSNAFTIAYNFGGRRRRPQGLRFLELVLFGRQLADLLRVNPVESLLEVVSFLQECGVRGARLIELSLLHRALRIQQPGAIALRVKAGVLRRNFILRIETSVPNPNMVRDCLLALARQCNGALIR